MLKQEEIKNQRKFWGAVIAGGLAVARNRKELFKGEIPAGHFLLKGLHHSYLVEIKNKKRMGRKYYYETYVKDYYPDDDNGKHLGERHNLLLRKDDKRKVIVILNH